MAEVTLTNVDTLIDPLKRAMAVPGVFDEAFANTSDDDLINTLVDAFYEAKFDGFFSGTDVDLDTGDITPEITRAYASVIILYASSQVLFSTLRNVKTSQKYVAGPVSAEWASSATLLKAELDRIAARKDDILERQRLAGSRLFFLDGYMSREANTWFRSWEY